MISRAVGAIDNDLQPVQAQVLRERVLGELDVPAARIVDPASTADLGRLSKLRALPHPLLDRALGIVAQFVSVGAEQLDAIVGERIVRSRNHHAEIGAHRAGQHRHRRRRHRAGEQHVHADRGEARDQRGLDHIAAEPGVLADQHAMAVITVLENQTRGLAHLERKLRRDRAVGTATNSIGAEIFANHALPRPRL